MLYKPIAIVFVIIGSVLSTKLREDCPSPYTIKPGDTLNELAKKFNTTVDELVKLNNISNPDLILAGATLKLPCASA